ncbi:sensor histidine kinase [Chitinimonas naiadis]
MDRVATSTEPGRLLDQPLPAEVSAQIAGWLARARNYPIFSWPWYCYRTLPLLLIVLVLGVATVLIRMGAEGDWRVFWVPFISISLSTVSLITVGPGVAVWLRRRGWPANREGYALVAIILGGVLLSDAVETGGRYLAKALLLGDGTVELAFEFGGKASLKGGEQKPAEPDAPPQPVAAKAVDEREHAYQQGIQVGTLIGRFVARGGVYVFMFWLGGGWHLIGYFRQRGRVAAALRQQELQRAKAARNEAELRLSVLAAQIEPHFLFNTLAGVRSAVSSDPQRATAIIDNLVDYLRATIPQLRSDGSSAQACLSAQLNAAKAYLGLMRARIPRLSYSVEIEPGLADLPVPPLLLISLVENAVKHGIEPKIGAGHIEVHAARLTLEGEPYLALSVSDDGVGFGGDTSGSGIGLSNIDERLRELYGKRASLALKARPEGGVLATIQIPLSQ